MAGEKTIRYADLIRQHYSKGQTHQTRSQPELPRKVLVPFPEEVERGGNAHGDQHHPANGTSSENEQVSDRPVRIPDGRENQQGYRGGTRESMNDANDQRTQLLIETDPAK